MQRVRYSPGGYKAALFKTDPSRRLYSYQEVPAQQENSKTGQPSGVSFRARPVALSYQLHQQNKQGKTCSSCVAVL